MSWQEFRARAKIIEQNFAKNLKDPIWANDYQDMQEHWDVKGKPGWVKGKADYIVFERTDHWLLVQRQELLNHVESKLKEKNFEKGKGIYQIYQREGRLDKITMVPFQDMEQLTNIKRINKNAETNMLLKVGVDIILSLMAVVETWIKQWSLNGFKMF